MFESVPLLKVVLQRPSTLHKPPLPSAPPGPPLPSTVSAHPAVASHYFVPRLLRSLSVSLQPPLPPRAYLVPKGQISICNYSPCSWFWNMPELFIPHHGDPTSSMSAPAAVPALLLSCAMAEHSVQPQVFITWPCAIFPIRQRALE